MTDIELLQEWVDVMGERCWYDHNGDCQAHFIQPKGECIYELTLARLVQLKKSQEDT